MLLARRFRGDESGLVTASYRHLDDSYVPDQCAHRCGRLQRRQRGARSLAGWLLDAVWLEQSAMRRRQSANPEFGRARYVNGRCFETY